MKAKFIDIDYKPLTKRGISLDTCKKYHYGTGTYQGEPVQVASYFDSSGLIAQHLRLPDKQFKWLGDAKKVSLFGQTVWPSGGKRIVITEGEIDALTISQAFNNRWPVVSVPNGVQSAVKYIKKELEYLESYHEIVLALDDDEPGQAVREEVSMLFTPGKLKVMTYDGLKDANELLQAKGSSVVCQAVFQAKPYRPDGIIPGTDLWEAIQAPLRAGFTVPYPDYQDKTKGVRKRELVLFTAGSGIGKSTFVNEIAYHLMMEHGQSLGIIALEEGVKRSAERYMSIHLNKPIHISREGVSEEELKAAYEATIANGKFWLYDHWGSTEIENLMGKIRYMAVGLGVDFVILDHISIVVSGMEEVGETERKTIDRLMTRLRQVVEETGIGILAVVHLKRPGQGASYNEGRQVSLSDLRGSGSLEQLSDIVVALERDQQGDSPNISQLRILKNRPIGICGEADALEYHQDTGRLLVSSGFKKESEEEPDF